MRRETSCSICYEPVFMAGCCEVLPIVTCASRRQIKKIAHRKKLAKH